MNSIIVSICIPSYNRPNELKRLLESIDSKKYINDIEVVICEDNSPKRKEIRKVVKQFQDVTSLMVNYIENEQNCGFDRNLRNLINNAKGEFITFMGDDDMFISNTLDSYIEYINEHRNCGYILRSYRNIYKDGSVELFRYFDTNKEFEASDSTYVTLFDKSVFISGFTIRRSYAKEYETDRFDSSLLYQMYLLAEVCRKYPSSYYHIPIVQAIEGGVPFFGSSESEKGTYDPGEISVKNSINFMNWYVKIIDYIADKYQNDTNKQIKYNMSKYSFAFMKYQRGKGIKVFNGYVKELKKMGFDSSFYFYIYYLGLLLFGEKFCTKIIKFLKKIIGRRPTL